MALSRITANSIQDGTVVAADIADGSITGPKLGATSINANNIVDSSITSAKIVSVANTQITGNITSSQIVPDPVFNGNTTVTNLIVGAGSNTAPSIAPTGDTNTGIYFPAADNIGFATGGTIRGRWTTDGLCFGTDTAAANALDDYEEGTWTPVVTFGNASAGQSYSIQSGIYAKVGQVVLIEAIINFSNKGSSTGSANITGLPFTQNNSAYSVGTMALDNGFASISSNGFGVYALVANSIFYLRFNNSSGGFSNLGDSNFTNSSAMYVSAVYRSD